MNFLLRDRTSTSLDQQNKSICRFRPQLEQLEPRQMLAAAPIISEFMADNDSVLQDGNGNQSDWIEIYNAGDAAIDLIGWHLTDNPQDFEKWEFPSVLLEAGEFLVVFASGEGAIDIEGNLHTNFKLSAGGEYLALIEPDATTIATQFSPNFPPQLEDRSFGFAMQEEVTTLISSEANVEVLIPTESLFNSLGTTWQQPGFVPTSQWITESSPGLPAKTGVGYETGGLESEVTGQPAFYPIQSVTTNTVNFFSKENIIQGPGIGFDANAPHNALGTGSVYAWVTDAPGGFPSDYIAEAGPPVIVLDLGEDVLLSEISVWGYAAGNGNGVSEFNLRFATDAEGTNNFASSITYNPTFSPVQIDPIPRQSFVFSENVMARYVEFNLTDNYFGTIVGGDRAGLGEIAFESSVPQPPTSFYDIQNVSTSTEATDLYNKQNIIQGPGAGFTPNAPYTALGLGSAFTWVTAAPGGFPSDYIAVAGAPTIILDLGKDVFLSEISVWGYADTNSNGVSEFNLRFATEIEGTGNFGTSINYSPTFSPVLITPLPRQSFDFNQDVTARYVEFNLTDNHFGTIGGGDRAGLGEIAFAIPADAITPLINTDIQTEMFEVNASSLLRLPFNINDPTGFNTLSLNMKYDDGFVAYLNGHEVASRNAPNTLLYNSNATDSRPDFEAAVIEEISLNSALQYLLSGENILAIHGLNLAADNPDFLIAPELIAISRTINVNETGILASPTPAATNTLIAVQEIVTFSHTNPTFTDNFDLVLSGANAGQLIYYTTDQSIPTANSILYNGPITINSTTQIRAVVTQSGLAPSSVTSQGYSRLDPTVAAFSSQLPIMLIDNFGAGAIPNKGFPTQTGTNTFQLLRQAATVSLFEPIPNGTSSLNTSSDLNSRIGIRVRGAASSTLAPDPGYSVEAWTEIDEDSRKISPFGLGSDSDWVLYSPDPAHDITLIDNTLQFSLSNQMGLWAPEVQYVEAFINTDGGDVTMNDFVGLYVWEEKVKPSNDRLDFDKFSQDASSGGWLLNINRMDAVTPEGQLPKNFHTAGPDGILQTANDLTNGSGSGDDIPRQHNAYINYDSPSGNDVNPVQRTAISDWFATMEDVLYDRTAIDWNDPINGYMSYIDVDSFIDYFILNNFSKNGDGLLISMWIYNPDPNHGGKLTMGPIWDQDRGSFSGTATSDLFRRADRLWYPRMFQDPLFMQMYIDRWQELRQSVLSTTNVNSVIDDFESTIGNDAAIRDDVTNWSSRLQSMRNWISSRSATIDGQFLSTPVFNQSGGTVPAGFNLDITSSSGDIYYTLDGSDPRLPDGSISTTAIIYTNQPIVINETTTVIARTKNGSQWSGVTDGLFLVDMVSADSSNLRISEIHYHPINGVSEFIELLNISSQQIALNNVVFTRGIDFTFTNENDSLLPGERILVVRNQAAFAATYNTSNMRIANGQYGDGTSGDDHALDNGGETIRIEDAGGGLIQEFRYDDKTSEGWYDEADGQGKSLILIDATLPVDTWNDPASWRPSLSDGGSPGSLDKLAIDFSSDGKIGLQDLLHMKKNFGVGTTPEEGDLTGDNAVTTADLAMLLSQYGTTYVIEETPVLPPSAPPAAALRVVIDDSNATNSTSQAVVVDQVLAEVFDEVTIENRSAKQNNAKSIIKTNSQRIAIAVDQAHTNNLSTTHHRTHDNSLRRAHRRRKSEGKDLTLVEQN